MRTILALVGVCIIAWACATAVAGVLAAVGLFLLGFGLVGMLAGITRKSEPINRKVAPDNLTQWAKETTRGLPNSDTVARKLVDYVGSQEIDMPWDASTVEAVEAIMEDAAKTPIEAYSIKGERIFMPDRIKAEKITTIKAERITTGRIMNPFQQGGLRGRSRDERIVESHFGPRTEAEIRRDFERQDPRRETLELRELRRRQGLSEPDAEVREIREALDQLANAAQIGYDPENDSGGSDDRPTD